MKGDAVPCTNLKKNAKAMIFILFSMLSINPKQINVVPIRQSPKQIMFFAPNLSKFLPTYGAIRITPTENIANTIPV